jgi:hypothetical protein
MKRNIKDMEDLLSELDTLITSINDQIHIQEGRKMIVYAYLVGIAKQQLAYNTLLNFMLVRKL